MRVFDNEQWRFMRSSLLQDEHPDKTQQLIRGAKVQIVAKLAEHGNQQFGGVQAFSINNSNKGVIRQGTHKCAD